MSSTPFGLSRGAPSGVAPAFLRMTDVTRLTALSRATLYRRMAQGKFPAPVHLGGRACGWTPSALQAWIADPEGYVADQAANKAEALEAGARQRSAGLVGDSVQRGSSSLHLAR
jgi:prophage regulatory protein